METTGEVGALLRAAAVVFLALVYVWKRIEQNTVIYKPTNENKGNLNHISYSRNCFLRPPLGPAQRRTDDYEYYLYTYKSYSPKIKAVY